MRLSISRVKEVDALVEAVGGDGQGVEGTGQAGAEAAGDDAAGGRPSLVWSVDCLAFANLLNNLRMVQAAISTIMMTMVVVVVTVMIMQWSLTSLLAGVFSTRVITSSTTVMKPAQSVGTSLRDLIIQDSD